MKQPRILRVVFLSLAMVLAGAAQTGLNRWSSVKSFGFGSVDRSTLADLYPES